MSIDQILSKFGIFLTSQDDRNAWFLCVEIFWASILGAAVSFVSAYAIRLGATNLQIGYLTSIPALFAIIIAIPAGRFLQSRSRRKPWILWSLAIYRFGFILIAIVPWVSSQIAQGFLVVIIIVVMSIPVHFFNVGFTAMLGEVIHEERRAAVFSSRNIINSATLTVGIFIFGIWLNRIIFPLNYQLMFIFGYLASILSLYYLIKVKIPDSIPTPLSKINKINIRSQFRKIKTIFNGNPAFAQIVTNTTLYGIGLWLAASLYILYYVRQLGASDAWIGLQGTLASAGAITGFLIWRRGMMHLGEARTLKYTIICQGLFPLCVGLSHSLNLILVFVFLNGILSSGTSLSHFNTLLKVTPENNRPGYTAIYIALVNIGIFICPLVGVKLANIYGFSPVLIFCGLLSILGSMSFWLWPVVPHNNQQ